MYSSINQSILEEIKKDKKITDRVYITLKRKYKTILDKALNLLKEKCVKKYRFTPSSRIVWIVLGRLRDYLIIGDFFCTCADFYFNVIIRKRQELCYHLLSKILAENLNYYEEFEVDDGMYDIFMREWTDFEDR